MRRHPRTNNQQPFFLVSSSGGCLEENARVLGPFAFFDNSVGDCSPNQPWKNLDKANRNYHTGKNVPQVILTIIFFKKNHTKQIKTISKHETSVKSSVSRKVDVKSSTFPPSSNATPRHEKIDRSQGPL